MSKTNTSNNGSLKFVFLYLLLSFFAGLAFSILAYRSRKKGKYGFGWMFLALCCILFFGILAFSLFKTSSVKVDVGWYYLGLSTLISNGIAILLIIITLFTKRNGIIT
jgi:uncharacterized protein with PQ loop repeat